MSHFGRLKTTLGLVTAAGFLGVGAALAATAAAPLPAVVQRLLDCHATAAEGARLACYDAAVGELGRLLASGEMVIVDKERVAAVKRQAFGFSLPSVNLFERSDKPQELAEVAATAVRVHRKLDGHWSVELEDGAVWEQTDGGEVRAASSRRLKGRDQEGRVRQLHDEDRQRVAGARAARAIGLGA